MEDEEGHNYWAGGYGERDRLERFMNGHYWKIGWKKDEETKGARDSWSRFAKVRVGDPSQRRECRARLRRESRLRSSEPAKPRPHRGPVHRREPPHPSKARTRARQLRQAFPDPPPWKPDQAALRRLRLNRQTTRYQSALHIAQLILFHITASVAAGSAPLLALLFDMNRLWERYVATIARRFRLPGLTVHTQAVANFWQGSGNPRSLRPDIVLKNDDGKTQLVIDTKWKVPKAERAGSNALKQMFCYHELFGCKRSMLLFPSTNSESYVSDVGRYNGTRHDCELAFLAVDGDLAEDLRVLLLPPERRETTEISPLNPSPAVRHSPQ